MTEVKSLPLQIQDKIQEETQNLYNALVPLAEEAVDLLIKIRQSYDFRRLETIMMGVPGGNAISTGLNQFTSAPYIVEQSLNMEFPSSRRVTVDPLAPPHP